MKNWMEVQVEISVNQLWSDCRLGCPLKKKGATKLPLLMMLPEMCRWASSIKASENVRLIHSFVLSLCEGYSSFSSGYEPRAHIQIGHIVDNSALSPDITISS